MKNKKPKKKTESIIAKKRRDGQILAEGIFKGIQHRFTIIASSKAWIALQNKCFGAPDTYHYITKGLHKDLWPFITSAVQAADGRSRARGKTHFIEALKIEAALLYLYLKHTQKRRFDEIAGQTFAIVSYVWGDDLKYLGLQPTKRMSFLKGYINDGVRLLKCPKKTIKARLGILTSFLYCMKIKKSERYEKHQDEYELLWDITSTVDLLMSNPKTVFKSKKQGHIKDILKQHLPTLF